jgi:hypothetical protein
VRKALRCTLFLMLMVKAVTSLGASGAPPGAMPDSQSGTRTLVGYVFDRSDQPLPNAIVYLKNTKTLTVKTFIADGEASYRFHALSPNVDYEVWAEYQGAKSDTKTLSSFDSRANARINLKVNTK